LAQKEFIWISIEAMLNDWGNEGWEVTHVYTPEGSGKVTISINASTTLI
jgi:hypothetical protein